LHHDGWPDADHHGPHGNGLGGEVHPAADCDRVYEWHCHSDCQHQIKDFFGLKLEKVPGEFWLRIKELAHSFPTLSYDAAALAVATVLIIAICRGISTRIPGAIVAMVVGHLR